MQAAIVVLQLALEELNQSPEDGDREEIREAIALLSNELLAKSTRVSIEEQVFRPHWPPGLEMNTLYRFLCDDKGADGGSFFQVVIGGDSDAHLTAQDWERIRTPGTKPHPLPSIRCRTRAGGGRHPRTRQVLLWLARAIQLDNQENGLNDEAEPNRRPVA